MRRVRLGLSVSGVLLVACAKGGAGAGEGGPPKPVPVQTARAERREVPLTRDGLGSVTAYYTVTVHSRVDGELMKVAFTEGQAVKKGDLLAQIDPRPFQIQKELAEAALAKDEAQLVDDKLNFARYQDLRRQSLVAQQQVDDQKALVDQAAAAVKSDQANVDSAKLQLTYARITSPINGLTGVRQIDPGNIVHASDANGLVVVAQLDPIAVLFTLPEDDLPQIAAQMVAHKLTAEAFTRDGLVDLGRGEVTLVDNQINQTTGTIRLKAIFSNSKHSLWPNQFVKVRLLVSTRKDALVIPSVAVQRGPSGAYVYLVKADQTVEARPLTLGPSQADLVIVESGLAAGDRVVVDGQYKLHQGSLVGPRESQRPGALGGAEDGGLGGAR